MDQIHIEHVTKRYGDAFTLSDIDLRFEANTTTAIVGPSGGGKSTLLRLINGLVRPDAGRISVFGSPIDYERLPALRRRIGYAVQGTGLFPHMTVWQNITVLARLEHWTPERVTERAHTLMDLVGLEHVFESRYPHELSGGQQQRVGLCRAMMLNPPLFILDEPFAAVDPITRREIHAEFRVLEDREPRTIVIVTHDVGEALKLASRLIVVDGGRVVQHGDADDVAANPATQLVRDLFEQKGSMQ